MILLVCRHVLARMQGYFTLYPNPEIVDLSFALSKLPHTMMCFVCDPYGRELRGWQVGTWTGARGA